MIQERTQRAAKMLRGRFGCDVWQNWLDAGMHDQQDWLRKREPSVEPTELRLALIGILHREGLRREQTAPCCSTCENPIMCHP